MKKLLTAAVIASLSLTSVASIAATDRPAKSVNVKFKKGAVGAAYSGKVKGYAYDQYSFYARQGQAIKLTTTGQVDTYLFNARLADSVDVSAYSDAVNDDGYYVLPYTGNYQLRVLQTRNAARSGKVAPYTIEMIIR